MFTRKPIFRISFVLIVIAFLLTGILPTKAESLASGVSPWPMYGHDAAHTSYSPFNGPNTANLIWSYPLDVKVQDNASPIISPDGTIYIPSELGFFAVNPDGALKWKKWGTAWYDYTLTRQAPAVGSDGTVYVVSNDSLFALNPINGTTLWSYQIGGTTYGSPTIGPDGTIYIGGNSSNSFMYALNPNGTLKWQWDSGSSCWIESSPALTSNGAVVFYHDCLGLVALTNSGTLDWSRSELGEPWNSPSIALDGTIYIGDTDGYFHALNTNGTDKWKVPVLNWMYESASAISADGSTVYRGDNGGIFYAFNAAGSVKWQYDTGIAGFITSTPALTANGIVYFTQGWTSSVQAGDKGYVYALRAADGILLWKYEVGWSSSSPAIGVDGTLYVVGNNASDNAVLYAFRVPQTTFSDVPLDHPLYKYIEALYQAGYTAGCSTSPLMFCPDTILDRAQSAVFMLRGQMGSGYTPPAVTGIFGDNWTGFEWAQPWAEGMYQEGLTTGCQSSPLLFCPANQLPRVEASIFGLRMKYGVGYAPPAASGTLFADFPFSDPSYWGIDWAEQAYLDGLLPACGTDSVTGKPMFCPSELVDRGWGAYLIVKAKNLPTP